MRLGHHNVQAPAKSTCLVEVLCQREIHGQPDSFMSLVQVWGGYD